MIILILSEYIYRESIFKEPGYTEFLFFHMLHVRSHEEEPHVFLTSNEIGQERK